MVTDLDKSSAVQALADVTCFIYDRTVSPEKLVGQGWLISKGRVATLASNLHHYVDAPWALMIKFPHPNLVYGVRTLTIHPEFNKRAARDHYLSQATWALPPLALDYDIATIALDSELDAPPADRIGELNRALSLPFEISPKDVSGAMRSGDLAAILHSVLSTGRNGLMTMADSRNIPFARIAFRQMRIVKATYMNQYNESAICELIWRQPHGNFAFQDVENYRWPNDLPEMVSPTEQLLHEATRRTQDLTRLVEMLGGPELIFQKTTAYADFSEVPEEEKWLAETVWLNLDGYCPLSKLPQKVGTDSTSTYKTLLTLARMGLAAIRPNPPFHCNGQLGPMLIPAMDLDVSTWEPINAFHLDPITQAPVLSSGNFFGPAGVLSNRILLHTAPVAPDTMGAAILREGRLIGIHSGPHSMAHIADAPPLSFQRMIWVGALNDLGPKRPRAESLNDSQINMPAWVPDAEQTEDVSPQKLSNLRSRVLASQPATLEPPPSEAPKEEETGPLANFSKQQILVAASAAFALGLVMMAVSLLMPHGGPPAATTNPDTATQTATATETSTASGTTPNPTPLAGNDSFGDPIATQQASMMTGFGKPPDDYKYFDTTKLTTPKPSFGMQSDFKNVSFIFLEWPNQVPLQSLDSVAKRVPILNYVRKVDSGNEFFGQLVNCGWVGGHYKDDKGKETMCTIGAFKAPGEKCIIFLAQPYSGTHFPDPEYPAKVVDTLLSGRPSATAAEPPKTETTTATPDDGKPLATPAELAEYRKELAAKFKAGYKPPAYDLDTNTKVTIMLTVDKEGKLTEMSIDPNPDDAFNAALQKAVTAIKPLPAPPKTKDGKLRMKVRSHASNVFVEEP